MKEFKESDNFIRIVKKIKDHLIADGYELADYEIGHIASMWNEEIEAAKRQERDQIVGLITSRRNYYADILEPESHWKTQVLDEAIYEITSRNQA